MNAPLGSNESRPDIVRHLLLAKLLVPTKKPTTASQCKRDLEPFFKHAVSPGAWSELFEATRIQCLADGLIQEKPLRLTDHGREACLAYWNVTSAQLPAPLTWQSLIKTVIVPRALGIDRDSLQTKEPSKSLMLTVLRKSFQLPNGVRTQKDLLNALAWRAIGADSTEPFTPAAVVARKTLETDRPLKSDDVVKNLAKAALIPSEKDLFRAVVQKWAGEAIEVVSEPSSSPATGSDSDESRVDPIDSEPSSESMADELVHFAAKVQQAAHESQTGRFGDNKVFISHVWRQLHSQPEYAPTTLEQFKSRLVAAHRQQLLSLSRADLVERMNPQDVAESETAYLDARFHFIRI